MIVQSIYVIFQIWQISVDVLLRYVDFDTLSKKYKKKQKYEKRVKCVRYLRKEKCVFRKFYFLNFFDLVNENVKHKKIKK